jgi:hypothetical protein
VLLDGLPVAGGAFNNPVAAGNGIAFLDINIGALAPGLHSLTVIADEFDAIDEGLENNNSFTRNFSVVPGTPPAVTASQFLRETAPQQVTFTFSQNVSASLTAADFTGLGTPGVDYTLNYNDIANIATLTLNSILANGSYTVTAVAAGITNAFGIPMAADFQLSFKFLRGDADGDGDVDVNDLGTLASNWQQSPRTYSQGNFDYSANLLVEVNDLGILASHWQQVVAGPVMPSQSTSSGLSPGAVSLTRRAIVELIELTMAPA